MKVGQYIGFLRNFNPDAEMIFDVEGAVSLLTPEIDPPNRYGDTPDYRNMKQARLFLKPIPQPVEEHHGL